MKWDDFEAAAHEIAGIGRQRLEGPGLGLLGTLRQDGSPRISPVGTYFAARLLLFGVMSRSFKARDLARDARCVLHSVVTQPDAEEPEFKLYGHAAEVRDERSRNGCADAWWVSRPARDAIVFTLDIDHAALILWDIERSRMTAMRWSPAQGAKKVIRPYP